jgi:hypothetical protein
LHAISHLAPSKNTANDANDANDTINTGNLVPRAVTTSQFLQSKRLLVLSKIDVNTVKSVKPRPKAISALITGSIAKLLAGG